MVRLEAEIRGLMNVINDQHRYILELHNTQSLQLQQIPNTHLGPKNLYRGGWGRGPPAFDGGGSIRRGSEAVSYIPGGLEVTVGLCLSSPGWGGRLLRGVPGRERGQRAVRDPAGRVAHGAERLLRHEQRRRMDRLPEAAGRQGELRQVRARVQL